MSLLDELNPTEMMIFAGLFISRAEDLPKGDSQKAKLLRAAHQLLERSSKSEETYVLSSQSRLSNGGR